MTANTVEPGQEGPVTVSVSRRISPGREAEYEAWVRAIVEVASDFPGHQGVNILRPSGRTDGRYVLIYRYDSWANCEKWEHSQTRVDWVNRLGDMIEGEAQTHRVTGLEFWFDLPEVPISAKPSQHKMALVLIVVVFCLVFPLQLVLLPITDLWPHWMRSLLIVVIQVLVMTYLIMPRVTHLLKGWLFR